MADEAQPDRIVINTEDLAEEDPAEVADRREGSAPAPGPPLVITSEDLKEVEPEPEPVAPPRRRPRRRPTSASRVSLHATAGSVSALIAWAITEPFLASREPAAWVGVLRFGLMAGCMGFALGALEGVRTRNLRRSLRGGALAFATAAAAALAATAINARWIYQVLIVADAVDVRRVVFRTLAWSVLGAVVGLAQGVPYGSRWKITRGLLGGVAGGAAAGLFLYPLAAWTGYLSIFEPVALGLTGALTGLGVGLGQQVRRPAWLTVTRGPLSGCEFLLHQPTTTIGSDADCDIPLRDDPAVGAQHAAVRKRGQTPFVRSTLRAYRQKGSDTFFYWVEDLGSPSGTFVNNTLVRRHRLNNEDCIQVGRTVFVYHERDLSPADVTYDSAVGTC